MKQKNIIKISILIILILIGTVGYFVVNKNVVDKEVVNNNLTKVEELGIEIEFFDGYTKNKGDDGKWVVTFGPLVPSLGPLENNDLSHAYQLMTVEKRTTNNIVKEVKEGFGELLISGPKIKKINKLDVVEWSYGGYCENRTMVVVGQKVNYLFTSLGCFSKEEDDFDYFEKTVATMKFL